MKTQQSVKRSLMATAVLALACIAPTARGRVAQPVPNVPEVPQISTASQTQFQQQTHFLTFLGSFIPKSAASAKAYYTG
jgi:hypothetical protein